MTKAQNPMDLATLCVHAGVEPEPLTGAIMTPIFQTSTYVQPAPGKPLVEHLDYSRAGNPTRTALENALAALEGAAHAITFASGLAAEQAIAQILDPGDRVLVSEDVYGGTGRLFRRFFAKYGIEFEFLDLRDLAGLEQALAKPARMVWVETPTNPLLRIIDIAAVSTLAKRAGAIVVVDNTFCSPILQRPLELGADLVVHSSTKYIGVLSLEGDRGHVELLFSQPVSRRRILLGQMLGIVGALAGAEMIGFGAAGIVIFSNAGGEGLASYLLLLASAVALTAIFVAIAALIAAGSIGSTRTRALAIALVVWFVLLVVFDVAVLGIASMLRSGHASRLLIISALANPIDAIRTGALLGTEGTTAFGAASLALLRFTKGPVFAALAILTSVVTWIALPVLLATRRLNRADL